jgi:hypothetical protein
LAVTLVQAVEVLEDQGGHEHGSYDYGQERGIKRLGKVVLSKDEEVYQLVRD